MEKNPDPMFLKDWENNVVLLPDVNWPDIYIYLVNTSNEYTHELSKVYKSLKPYEFLFFTTKLTNTATFASLNISITIYYIKYIYQSCIFQRRSRRSPCMRIQLQVIHVIYFILVFSVVIVKSTVRSKTRPVRMLGGNKQIFRINIDRKLYLHGWVFYF